MSAATATMYDKKTANGDIERAIVDDEGGEGIELPSMKKNISAEEKDQISSELLIQFSLEPKEVVMTKRVGAGAFGEVFKGTCMGETVAIKTMIDVTEANVREFKAEIILTATLRHPNIVNFVGACWRKELMCLVLEWVGRGSLRDLLETRDLKWDDPLLKLASDIARGMNYLHNRKYYDEREGQTVQCIIHRDLKPDNALISEYTAAKLADFGTSRSKADDEDVTMTAVGTPLYCAPEIARGEQYDESVDVYSFGLTLMEMSVEQPFLDFIGERWLVAFDKKKVPKQAMRLIRPMTDDGWRPVTDENPIAFAPPSVNKLIVECCHHDPTKRPTFEHILERLGGECKNEVERKSYARRMMIERSNPNTAEEEVEVCRTEKNIKVKEEEEGRQQNDTAGDDDDHEFLLVVGAEEVSNSNSTNNEESNSSWSMENPASRLSNPEKGNGTKAKKSKKSVSDLKLLPSGYSGTVI
jgi:serine/threonine protein kinase